MSEQPLRPRNPYIGPRAYRPGETLYGRDDEVRELFYLLTAERIVLLHSPSGAGKTSLIQSALVPRLEAAKFKVLPIIRVGSELPAVRSIPTTAPSSSAEDQLLASLLGLGLPPAPVASQSASTLSRLAQPNRYILSTLASLDGGLPRSQQTPVSLLARRALEAYLRRRPGFAPPEGAEVLIFDQFEEILTVDPEDRAGKYAFFTELAIALRDRRRWALFAMREEYVAALAPYIVSLPTRLANTFRLDLLTAAAARRAIQEPAKAQGVEFTDTAATRLINDLRRSVVQRPDGTASAVLSHTVEPVQLQVVCLRLWDAKFQSGAQLAARSIVPDDIEGFGDVDQALTSYYEDRVRAVVDATGETERTVRDWFETALITAGGLRSQVIAERGNTRGLSNKAIALLINSHLVRAERRLSTFWYELAHDRLVAPIRAANAAWREANFSTLQRQAALWVAKGRSDGLLLSGQAFVEAETWATANGNTLTPDEQAFLVSCRAARDTANRERRAAQRIRNLAIGLLFALAVTVVLAVAALLARTEAVAQAKRADDSRASAQQAATAEADARGTAEAEKQRAQQSEKEARIAQAIALGSATEVSRANGTAIAERSQAQTSEAKALSAEERVQAQARDLSNLATSVANEQATNQAIQVASTAFADQKAVEFAGLQAEQEQTEQATRLNDFLEKADFIDRSRDVDASQMSSALNEGLTVIEEINRDQSTIDALQKVVQRAEELPELFQAIKVADTATLVTWDNAGQRVLVGSGRQLTLWDVATRQQLSKFTLSAQVTSAAWSSDGTRFVATSSDNVVRIWQPDSRSAMRRLSADGGATSAAWSPDDRLIVSAGAKTVSIWDAATGALLGSDSAGAGGERLTRAAWSIDGLSFVTAGDRLRIRDGVSGRVIPPMQEGATRALRSAAWSPNGQLILTVDDAGAVQIWDAVSLTLTRPLPEETPPASAAMWSPTGRYFVVAFTKGSLGVYTTDSLQEPIKLPAFQNNAAAVAWSPDGQRIVAAGDDSKVRVFFFYPDDVIQRARELRDLLAVPGE